MSDVARCTHVSQDIWYLRLAVSTRGRQGSLTRNGQTWFFIVIFGRAIRELDCGRLECSFRRIAYRSDPPTYRSNRLVTRNNANVNAFLWTSHFPGAHPCWFPMTKCSCLWRMIFTTWDSPHTRPTSTPPGACLAAMTKKYWSSRLTHEHLTHAH